MSPGKNLKFSNFVKFTEKSHFLASKAIRWHFFGSKVPSRNRWRSADKFRYPQHPHQTHRSFKNTILTLFLPLGRWGFQDFQNIKYVITKLLDVLWGQWIYLKLSTQSREYVRNNFGKIGDDLGPISWQEKRTLEVQKICPKTQDPQKFISLLPLGRESKFCLWLFF